LASWPLLLLWPLVAGFWPVFGSDPLQQRFPLEARGNIPFQVDAARFLGPDGPVVEVALSIPRDSLLAPGDSARLAIEIESLDRRKHSLGRVRSELRLPPAPARTEGGFPVPRGWVRLSPPWVEGTKGLRVRVENLARFKVGLYDRIREKHPDGEAAGRIVPADEPSAPMRLSDLLFVWGPSETVEVDSLSGGFRGIRARLEPNPYRYYGRFQPVLTVYWERYPGEGDDQASLVETRRVLQVSDSLEIAAESETLAAPVGASWMLRRYDLSGLAGGAYRFEVTLRRPGAPGGPVARVAGDFQVIWEERNWVRREVELDDIARVILPSEEFVHYSRLDRGGQETFLREFWNRHAPAEPGAVNPLEQAFEERRAYADRFFPGQRAGMLSDRGRVYIRLGPADEVRAQLNPQDEELLWIALPEEMADDGEVDRESRKRLSKRRTSLDNSAYETWEYTTKGDPLLPEYLTPGQKLGLKFIFVDEFGTGDYTLAYTNAPGVLQ
jgi:GWxTD domain-containing protein